MQVVIDNVWMNQLEKWTFSSETIIYYFHTPLSVPNIKFFSFVQLLKTHNYLLIFILKYIYMHMDIKDQAILV